MLGCDFVIADQRGYKALGTYGFEHILDSDDFLNVNLCFLTLDRLLDLRILTNGVTVFPPIGEYALALELIQNAEWFKRLRKERGIFDGKLRNTHIGMDAFDDGSGFFPEILECAVHSVLCSKNAIML